MREIRNKERVIEYKEFILRDEMINQVGELLDSEEGLHIEEVYFTIDGSYYFRKTDWKGDDGKQKSYAYLQLENKQFFNANGQAFWKLTRIGKPKLEIVRTYSADELVEKYLKLLKNKK